MRTNSLLVSRGLLLAALLIARCLVSRQMRCLSAEEEVDGAQVNSRPKDSTCALQLDPCSFAHSSGLFVYLFNCFSATRLFSAKARLLSKSSLFCETVKYKSIVVLAASHANKQDGSLIG